MRSRSRGSIGRSSGRFRMRRREFLRNMAAAAGLAIYPLAAGRARGQQKNTPSGRPLEIGTGPQLFLDDYLLEQMEGLKRQVRPPERLASPVLDSKTFGVTQPYVTVLHDRDRKRYRAWYNHGPAVW